MFDFCQQTWYDIQAIDVNAVQSSEKTKKLLKKNKKFLKKK